jgi:hypothetical protein
MFEQTPPRPIHVPGTHKGEETTRKRGKEPGRHERGARGYRSARDAMSLNPAARDPIDPQMPCIPPA